MKKTTPIVLVLLAGLVAAAEKPEETIALVKVAGNVHCIKGPGGNIGVLEGKKSLLVVDAKFPGTAEGVLKELIKLGSKPVRYLINTHYHQDHTGGNPAIGKNATIVSHENCKSTFMKGLKKGQAARSAGVPDTTYQKEKTIEFEGETVHMFFFGPGHTSGDTVVVFEESKVVHTGDLFFHGIIPYIDVADGSDTGNWISTIETLARRYPGFKVIPGHGEVTDMKKFLEFAQYLKALRNEAEAAIKAGKTRKQAMESVQLKGFESMREKNDFMTRKNNIGWVYDEMKRK